ILSPIEWARICPDLLERVDGYRQQITELMLYNPRRKVLVGLYNEYVRKPAPPGAAVDMLPHVADLATFPPFDDIIKAPKGTSVGAESFQAAFAQLPSLVQGWRDDIEAQLGALVVTPRESVDADSPTPGYTGPKPSDRLKLASAVFSKEGGVIDMFPDVILPFYSHSLFNARCVHTNEETVESITADALGALPWSLTNPHGVPIVQLFTPAADVVRACGLDPRTATREDMDARNARLICKDCPSSPPLQHCRTWKNAV
ncbi:hypothetical protein HYDPIDRAFT_48423, partial [Hydnomerulius pinastri MD-312]